jgi:Spx/MgsR family transcriptional regulator
MNPLPLTLYGIPNCDTVKKARAWLTARGLAHAFHDFKKQGLPEAELAHWLNSVGWETLLNRKGTSWRKLDPQLQAGVHDAHSAAAVMRLQPSVIKRPVVQWGLASKGTVTVGFDAASWAKRAGSDKLLP